MVFERVDFFDSNRLEDWVKSGNGSLDKGDKDVNRAASCTFLERIKTNKFNSIQFKIFIADQNKEQKIQVA